MNVNAIKIILEIIVKVYEYKYKLFEIFFLLFKDVIEKINPSYFIIYSVGIGIPFLIFTVCFFFIIFIKYNDFLKLKVGI